MTASYPRRTAAALIAAACAVLLTSCIRDAGGEPTASSSAAPSSDDAGGAYLALGDSVPFGFRGGAVADFRNEDAFIGYPELVAAQLGLELVNASCPGETTASFLDPRAQSNGCQNSLQAGVGYRTGYPLHVRYESPGQSQLDFAVDTLTGNEDVELVTLQVGANDTFLCQRTTPTRCTDPADLQVLAETVQANLDRILSTLRRDAGYDGQIVVVTYYALDYSTAFGATTRDLNAGLARVAGANDADVADGFGAFESRASEAGGDSVAAGLVLPNDVHPTEEGQRLLADAVTAVVED